MHPTPRAWLPLAFVVVALILLFGTPLVVSYRVKNLRDNLFDVADQMRVVVNDFEATFATEVLGLRSSVGDSARAATLRTVAATQERQQERALDSLAARLGPDAVERVVLLRAAEQRWRESNTIPAAARLSDTSPDADGRGVLATAEDLDNYLVSVTMRARDQVTRLEQMNVYFAAVLAPIALIAVAVVFMLDRRMRKFAGEADDRAKELHRAVELRASLIRGVTHDIKNPLGAASGYAELLEDGVAGPMNPRQVEMVRRFKVLVSAAQQTVTELLDLARVDGGGLSVEQRETDIVATVRDVFNGYEAGAAQKGIALTLDTPQDTVPVKTDAGHVRHVLENLVSNAIKYTPPGGAVAVGVKTADGPGNAAPHIAISVRDNGPGIPLAFRERIFDEFYRAPSSDPEVPGSGLGLAISRRIAHMLGGDISLSDAPEHGSIFTLLLPMSEQLGDPSRS
ncbi:MAG: HAMP domain-containing sensor histidine kinase [Gemmatimonadaceae bacterium]